jgi:pyruvate dehydrogenase E1 component alpha subunit
MTNPRDEQTAVSDLATNTGFSLISNEKLRELYATMLQCRMIDERVLFERGNATGDYYAPSGQEASVVGVAVDLSAADSVVTLDGASNAAFVHGEALQKLLSRLVYGSSSVDAEGRIHGALGVALAGKTNANQQVVVVFGGGEVSQSKAWQEALKVAGTHTLPLIFVQLGSKPQQPQVQRKGREAATQGEEWGLPVIPVDGNDVVAVYRVATESVSRARRGRGATLIECVDGAAIDPFTKQDPLLKMERYLTGKGLFQAEWKQEITVSFRSKLDAAKEAARSVVLA